MIDKQTVAKDARFNLCAFQVEEDKKVSAYKSHAVVLVGATPHMGYESNVLFSFETFEPELSRQALSMVIRNPKLIVGP